MAGLLEPLYEAEWQKMRVSFLAANNEYGGFTRPQGVKNNIERLNQYVTFDAPPSNPAVPNSQAERSVRVWRALNLMNATRMGYSGQGKVGSDMDQAVKGYQAQLQDQYDGHTLVTISDNWNWSDVQTKLEEMYRNDDYWFRAIYHDLSRRKRSAFHKQGTLDNRNALVQFLSIMDAIRGT